MRLVCAWCHQHRLPAGSCHCSGVPAASAWGCPAVLAPPSSPGRAWWVLPPPSRPPLSVSPTAAGGLCRLQIRPARSSSSSIQRQVGTAAHWGVGGDGGGMPISPPAPSRPAAVPRAMRMELAISGCPRFPVPPGSGLFVVGPWWGDRGVVGGGNRVQQPLGSCWGWRTPPRVSNTPLCLLLVTAECTQRQTPTTTPSAPPPRTASAPW